jgi:mono/diheme cytochrome c family protein
MSPNAVDKETTDFQFHTRASSAAAMVTAAPTEPVSAAYPQVWLRLKRTGDEFVAYVSRNPVDWVEVGRTTLPFSPTADLLWGVACTAGETAKRAIATVHFQSKRIQRWTFPGQTACGACHTQAAGWILGANTRQLNCTQYYSSTKVTDNQLRSWTNVSLLENPPLEPAIPTLSKLSALTDTTASLENRARSYLDSNCASCHRPGGVQAQWDARWDTPLASQGIIGATPLKELGIPGAKIVAPADPAHSLIHFRSSVLGGHQMPPLGKNKIDTAGLELLRQWIMSLPP